FCESFYFVHNLPDYGFFIYVMSSVFGIRRVDNRVLGRAIRFPWHIKRGRIKLVCFGLGFTPTG
ncbi:MAG: hypothetical protein JW837_11515, partial [Sedimentisphaerales bacterium]|nr:hypothetical protein [Sedimentisphaerales bacterium]